MAKQASEITKPRAIANLGRKGFGDNWVYYERLQDDFGGKYRALYNSVKSYMKNDLPGIDSTKAYNRVKRLAELERKKENEALKRVFLSDVNTLNPEDLNIKELVECFNLFLNTSELFQRNLALILESQGQKNTASFFDYYLEQTFNSEEVQNDIREGIMKHGSVYTDLPRAVKEVLYQLMPSIIEKALNAMAAADVESGIKKNRDKYADAYKELFKGLSDMINNGNPIVQEIFKIYKLDDLILQLSQKAKLLKNNNDLTKNSTKINKKGIVKVTGSKQWALAGNFREVMEAFGIGTRAGKVVDIKSGNFHIEGTLSSERIGDKGAATDVIASIKFPEEITKELNETPFSSDKMSRVGAFIKFSENLKKYKDSLIIHISSKNYTLNEGFKERGGYGTTQMTPESLWYTLNSAGIHIENLITMIINLCDGAIGQDLGIETDIENEIAQYFAYIFFDDAQTIGEEMVSNSSGISIHVLDLNGVEVPLSVFLEFLADSIAQEKTRETVKVDISAPQILYPEKNTPASSSQWNEQRNYALRNTKISTHFLSNIRDLFSNF